MVIFLENLDYSVDVVICCRVLSLNDFLTVFSHSNAYTLALHMKTQHIKFELLNERLSVFKCNLIQLNFVLNMLFFVLNMISRICDANFHPFGDVRDDVTRSLMFDTGKLGK